MFDASRAAVLVQCFIITIHYRPCMVYFLAEVTAMRVAQPVLLRDEQRTTLERWSRGRSTPVRTMERARMILMAAEGNLRVPTWGFDSLMRRGGYPRFYRGQSDRAGIS